MSESVDPLAGERCADCLGAPVPEAVPVLGPYIGVVGAVLCVLVGAFLLLAPYAFGYRADASATARPTVVDLTTGGTVAGLGLLTAALFGATLARRLRVPVTQLAYDAEPHPAATEGTAAHDAEMSGGPGYGAARPAFGLGVESEPVTEARPLTPPAAAVDPGDALRDLLTPLVAALAADLRAREGGGETEGKQL